MSDIPHGISIAELRGVLDKAENEIGGPATNIPVLIEVQGKKKPLMLTGDADASLGMLLLAAK